MGDRLPFDITARLADRGQVMLLASVDGQQVTSERYTPGDGDERRKVAKRWASDRRLVGERLINVDAVADELDRLEQDALAERDKLEADATNGPNVIERASYVDGDMMAELAWNAQRGQVDLLAWEQPTCRLSRADRLEAAGQVCVPLNPEASVLCTPGFGQRPGAVLLPTDATEYGDDETLLADVLAFVHRYVELPEPFEQIAAWYAVFTYVFDRFDELAYLLFRTPDIGRGKSRALETVGAICCRPIFAAGASSAAALRRILSTYRGTLVGDEQDHLAGTEMTATWVKIHNLGFQRGRPLVVCDMAGDDPQPQSFDVYGPKLLAARKRFIDDALESRCLAVPMRQRTRRDIPINLPRERFDAEALELRNKLTLWRFRNWHRVRLDGTLAVEGVEDRLNQIAVPLLSVVSSDAVRGTLADVLRSSQAELVQQRAESWEAVIVGYLHQRWTADADDEVLVGEVARHVNQYRADQEGVEPDRLRKATTPHKAGSIVRNSLGLQTAGARDGKSRAVVRDMGRLGELAARYCPDLPEARTPLSEVGKVGKSEVGNVSDDDATSFDFPDSSDFSGEGVRDLSEVGDESGAERFARLEDAPDLRDVHGLRKDDCDI